NIYFNASIYGLGKKEVDKVYQVAKIPIIPMLDSSNLFLSDTGQPFMAKGLYYCDPIITKDSLDRFDLYDNNGEPYNPYLLAGEQFSIKADGLCFKETEDKEALIVGLDKDFVVLLSNSVLPKK
ncbi:MAG: hypothetical protein PHD83_06295, partial [Caldisericia bacterium]|nr:hypothetical protein [Caldisericia bacterium]